MIAPYAPLFATTFLSLTTSAQQVTVPAAITRVASMMVYCSTSDVEMSDAELGTFVTIPTGVWFEIPSSMAGSAWFKLASSTATLDVIVYGGGPLNVI